MPRGPAGTNAALPPPQDVNAEPKLPGEIRLSWWRNTDAPSHDLVDRHQYRYRVRDAGASVAEGEPLRFTVWRDQRHGPMVAIVRISEIGDMLPLDGRSPEGLWHEQVHFGDGNERIRWAWTPWTTAAGPSRTAESPSR